MFDNTRTDRSTTVLSKVILPYQSSVVVVGISILLLSVLYTIIYNIFIQY